ncbi:MAG TPA: MFS transporter [Steroidobacteraceae bacterium]|nr:MFS transporter [Steroidobacteraceae bacterium]
MSADPGARGGASRSGLGRFIQRLIVVEAHELPALLAAFAGLFFMFASYTMLRPIRETMGIDSGVEQLPALFWGTFIAMLLVQPVYGWLTSRYPRTKFLPWVYGFFTANILAFWLWFNLQSDHTWIARAYFVWVSVFTLFIVAVFWSLMADVFTREQAGRMFGFIAAGASTGGLVGPFLAGRLAVPLGTINLLLISSVLLATSLVFILKVIRWHRQHGVTTRAGEGERALGGTSLAGFKMVVSNPYLLGIGFFVLLLTWASTFMYLEQQKLVAQAFTSRDARTQFFSNIDFWVQAFSLLTQVLIFGRLFKRVGLTPMIVVVPLLMMLGYAAYALVPTFVVAVGVMIVRRVGEYSIARPCRDTLYTVVSREEKYKAKSLIDTFIYRGGDATSGSIHQLFSTTLGVGSSGIGWLGAAVCAIWAALSYSLGRANEARRAPAPMSGTESSHA